MMEILAAKMGRRGTVVLPAKLRRRLGIEQGLFVVAKEREDGFLILPATCCRSRFTRRSVRPSSCSTTRRISRTIAVRATK